MKKQEVFVTILVLLMTVGVIFSLMWGIPTYNVWQKALKGKSALREAEWNRQVQIEEAKANYEAEKLNALAEIERAKGMAKAIEIEQGKLTDMYIKYLWVRQNKFNENTVIYIPTEANIPILEAGRFE